MRKLALFLICLLLSGCQAVTFSVDSLLSAPNIADEQSAIYNALIESAGRGITLVYPKNGDFRSAFILKDLDGDGSEEAIAFYSVNAVADSSAKAAVLDRGSDGDWYAMYELAGEGSSVDKVMFCGEDMIVGYSSREYEDSVVCLYRYTNGVLELGYANFYTVLEMRDIDGCGEDEIIVVSRSGYGVSLDVLKSGGSEYQSYVMGIDAGEPSVASCSFGQLDGKTAMYLDLPLEGGGIFTEVVVLGNRGLSCPISENGLRVQTQRPAGYLSCDYDGDGVVEIPVVSAFRGYESAEWNDAEHLATMLSFDPSDGELKAKSSAYYNAADGYIFTIPNRWLNMVTVMKNAATGEVTFYRFDPEKGDIADMTPLVSFVRSQTGDSVYPSQGYTEISGSETAAYYYRTEVEAGEPLVLTADEIINNFHMIA